MNNNNEYINFLKGFENKPIIIVLKNDFIYESRDFKLIDGNNSATFTDRTGSHNLIDISQIKQIREDTRKNESSR